eukprot:13665019-Heterocapsa_arctica.AAC.1
MYTDIRVLSSGPPNAWPLNHYWWLESVHFSIELVFGPHRARPAPIPKIPSRFQTGMIKTRTLLPHILPDLISVILALEHFFPIVLALLPPFRPVRSIPES